MKTKTNEFHFNVEQKSDEWLALKVGKVSGSQIIGLSTPARMRTYLYDKVAEVATGELPFVFVNEFMKRGNDMEPVARDLYNSKPENGLAIEVGIVTNPDFKHGVLSPDGLIFDDESGECVGGLEIKCPTSKTHVQTILDGGVPSKNFHQILWYFVTIPTMKYLDFMSYDDRCKGNEEYYHRLLRSDIEKEIAELIAQYQKFEEKYKKYLVALDLD